MPRVTFLPSALSIEVPKGTTLYEAAKLAGLPLASSCNADFTCGKCNVQIIGPTEALSPQSEAERVLLKRERQPTSDRIGCQTRILEDVTITTRYW